MRSWFIPVGLSFASLAAGIALGHVVGEWFMWTVFGLMTLQLLMLAGRPLVIPYHHTTESAVMWFKIYLLIFDFFLFVTVVAMPGVEREVRMGMITSIVILMAATGAFVLRYMHLNQFSQVRH
ncbi:MAG: hypothetical protein KBD50_03755 [Candidatus Pacebacteria bacterium]|nr:hypothetical protein [Candidatus Paceibacterota bacterium]